jgi:hypothetical protein
MSDIGGQVEVTMTEMNETRQARIVPIPFHDPKKAIAAG